MIVTVPVITSYPALHDWDAADQDNVGPEFVNCTMLLPDFGALPTSSCLTRSHVLIPVDSFFELVLILIQIRAIIQSLSSNYRINLNATDISS